MSRKGCRALQGCLIVVMIQVRVTQRTVFIWVQVLRFLIRCNSYSINSVNIRFAVWDGSMTKCVAGSDFPWHTGEISQTLVIADTHFEPHMDRGLNPDSKDAVWRQAIQTSDDTLSAWCSWHLNNTYHWNLSFTNKMNTWHTTTYKHRVCELKQKSAIQLWDTTEQQE